MKAVEKGDFLIRLLIRGNILYPLTQNNPYFSMHRFNRKCQKEKIENFWSRSYANESIENNHS